MSDTTQPGQPTVISPTAPAPAAPATPAQPSATTPPTPAVAPAVPAPNDDSVTISKKKIISPLTGAEASAAPSDIHALLAKEGMTLDAPAAPVPAPAPAPGAAQPQAPAHGVPGMAPMQHQPGHVISPTPTNSAGQPLDPNSISL